jgi:hypothetical protein
MKQLMAAILLALCAFASKAQQISAAEYFIDNDPGAGSGVPITVTAGSTSNFIATIPTASLASGFHVVAIRTKDSSGYWGLYESRGIYISSSTANASDIGAAEFFVDSDPGAGNATPIAPITNGSTVSFAVPVATGALTQGFHIVAIRTKDNGGQWGLYESRGFYISTSTGNAPDITAAEFFVDTDPGVGNGTAITPISNGNTVSFATPIPTTSLATGFHFLAIRTRDINGQWGLYESRGFYISTSTGNAPDITAAEFFVDTDPGVGNGTAITPISSGNTVSFTTPIATTSLAPGFHFLAIRTKDNNGQWGLYESRGFYISTATTNMTDMTAAEYFIDSDPGVGNATPIGITTGQTFSQNLPLLVPLSTTPGSHFIAIRFKDANGHWGLYAFDTITVSGSIPVTGLSLMAQKREQKIVVQWFTLSEYNSSHFDLERSSDGTRFEKITQVAAAGSSNSRRDYGYIDATPLKGNNHYRIRQVDRDGQTAYSTVQVVRMDKQQPFAVFPTITSDMVSITGIDGPVQLRLYNAAKQLVQHNISSNGNTRLSLQKLPAGSYWLLIERDGVLLQYEMLIKQ